jgi:hypothetical protein
MSCEFLFFKLNLLKSLLLQLIIFLVAALLVYELRS